VAVAADESNSYHIRNHSSKVVVLLPEKTRSTLANLAACRRMDCTVVQQVALVVVQVVPVEHQHHPFFRPEGATGEKSRSDISDISPGV